MGRLISPEPISSRDKYFDSTLVVLETFADPSTYISEISFVVTINCVLSIAFPKNFTLLDVLKRSVLFLTSVNISGITLVSPIILISE